MDYHIIRPKFSVAQKKSSHNRSILVSLAIIIGAIGTFFTVYILNNTDTFRRSEAAQDVKLEAALEEKVKAKGKLSVIVRLSVDDTPESKLSLEKKIEKKNKIKDLQKQTEDAVIALGAEKLRKYETLPIISMEVNEAALTKLKQQDGTVDLVVEDKLLKPALNEVPSFIFAPQAYDYGYDGTGTQIAIIDSGAEKTHPFLKHSDGRDKVVAEACFSNQGSCFGGNTELINENGAGLPCGLDYIDHPENIYGCSHGTQVSGIAAGGQNTVDGLTFAGIAKGSDLVIINTISRYYGTNNCGGEEVCAWHSESDILKALDWVYKTRDTIGVDVVNISISGSSTYQDSCSNFFSSDRLFMEAFNLLSSVNIPVVIATGNLGIANGIGYPACVPGSIKAGSFSTQTGEISTFSNQAPLPTLFLWHREAREFLLHV